MHKLTETVRSTIIRHRMVVPGGMVVAAVSGGPDSMAMLHVLRELSPELGISIAVAHLDHGFRPEAADESRFVAAEAERIEVPFVSEKAGLKESLRENPENKQNAARNARYGFLERVADSLGASRIAVGHTADDQAETWLMRELRGSGAGGLSSIPPVRGRIIRPLIDVSRDDIMDYLAFKQVGSITDQSNLQPVYLRNRVRLELIPLLKKYNPKVVEALNHSVDILRAEDEFLTAYTDGLLPGLLSGSGPDVYELDLNAFMGLPAAIKRRVLRQLIERLKGDLLGIGFGHIIDAEGMASAETGKGVDLPGDIRVERSYGRLLVYRMAHMQQEYCLRLPVPGTVELPGAAGKLEASLAEHGLIPPYDAYTAILDLEKISTGLTVRNRRPGDIFCPEGMEGSKKVKEYFIDSKVPRMERDMVPVLVCGNDVVWLAGRRRDRRFLAGKDCTNPVLVKFVR